MENKLSTFALSNRNAVPPQKPAVDRHDLPQVTQVAFLNPKGVVQKNFLSLLFNFGL
jgi:hypothetical protein